MPPLRRLSSYVQSTPAWRCERNRSSWRPIDGVLFLPDLTHCEHGCCLEHFDFFLRQDWHLLQIRNDQIVLEGQLWCDAHTVRRTLAFPRFLGHRRDSASR